MKTLAIAVAFGMLAASPSWAQEETPAQTLAGLQSNIATATSQNPHLADVRLLVSSDCRSHFATLTEPRQTAFCQCASTVTLAMWFTSEDQMMPLLRDYVASPTQEKLNAFLRYEGPELYQPFCDEAVEG